MTKFPPWYEWARAEKGQHEIDGPRSNERILQYRTMAGISLQGDDGAVPWCKIFVNAAMRYAGFAIQANAMARSIEHDPNFRQIPQPFIGAICSFWRVSPHDGRGHIGFYDGENGPYVWALSGNEGDAVASAPFKKNGATFGLVGYYAPIKFDLPPLAPVIISGGVPVSRGVSVV